MAHTSFLVEDDPDSTLSPDSGDEFCSFGVSVADSVASGTLVSSNTMMIGYKHIIYVPTMHLQQSDKNCRLMPLCPVPSQEQ